MKSFASAAAALALLAACSGPPTNEAAPSAPGNGAAAPGPVAPNQNLTDLPPPAAINPALYVPAPGTYQGRAMALAPPAELQALQRRMSEAVRANPAWYRAWLQQYPEGELPYHANFGVTEAEYRRFFALTRQIGLREIGPVTFTVTRRPDGGRALTATGEGAPLTGIVVAADNSGARTSYGNLGVRSPIDNREQNSPTGPWRGVQWSNLGAHAQRPVRLAFGRRAQGDMIIFYDYGPSDAETVILLYTAAGAAG